VVENVPRCVSSIIHLLCLLTAKSGAYIDLYILTTLAQSVPGAEIAVLHVKPDPAPTLQVRELTLALRRISDKLTLTENAFQILACTLDLHHRTQLLIKGVTYY
jgi:hypothetical protein